MRSEGETPSACEETDVKVICALEEADGEYKDCPVACRAEKDNNKDPEDIVVKSGDLAVTAKAADGRKVVIGVASDLDTLTFKTSEAVDITKVVLERYGYSTVYDVANVRLEDEDGNMITEKKPLNSKGQANLTIKKDYRTVDGMMRATVVVETNSLPDDKINDGETKQGSTLGFKVVSTESTAKNLNLDDYSPYTYDLVNYDGSKVTFSIRGSDKKYAYEAGESYEVSKFRVKSPSDAAILVNGFTLKNLAEENEDDLNKLDDRRYVEDVTVTFDGEKVKGLKWNINKTNELVISFDEVEIAAKKDGTFAVNVALAEDFDQFGYSVQYKLEALSKFNAVDKKTGTRIGATQTDADIKGLSWSVYTFNGGKIKLSGTKLGTVNAAAGSEKVTIADGEISVTEAVRGDILITITEGKDYVEDLTLVVNGEEFDGSVYSVAATQDTEAVYGYKFNGVEIEKSGSLKVKVSVKSEATPDGSIKFGPFNSASFTSLVYDESNSTEAKDQVVGSVQISNVKIQAAKASLKNNLTKKVNFVKGEFSRKTIFDGTYTSKKGDVNLTGFLIEAVGTALPYEVTFYVTIDGTEYDVLFKDGEAKDSIDLTVAAGKSVNVKVEAEFAPTNDGDSATYNLALFGEDEEGNAAGEDDEDTVKIATVAQGTLDVDSTAKNTVLLKSNRNLAEFYIKPSATNDEDVTLEELVFTLSDDTLTNAKDVKVEIDGDDVTCTPSEGTWTCANLGLVVPADGAKVIITLKSEYTKGPLVLTVTKVNDKVTRAFNKYYVPALVYVSANEPQGDTTNIVLGVEKEGSESITNVYLHTDDGEWHVVNGGAAVANKDNIEIKGTKDQAKWIDAIAYCVDDEDCITETTETDDETGETTTTIDFDDAIMIEKATYNDYFKVGNSYAKVSAL